MNYLMMKRSTGKGC